jgi:hypothetical protein
MNEFDHLDVGELVSCLREWASIEEDARANTAYLEGVQEELGERWERLIEQRNSLLLLADGLEAQLHSEQMDEYYSILL